MPRFLPLRPSHALALFALATAACTAPAEMTAPDAGSDEPSSNASVPAALVGAWRYGSISPTNFWNDHTGVYSGNAYGMSDHYVFDRNGGFKEYVYIYTQSYGCRTQAWVEMSGKARFDASTFSTEVTVGRFKTSDSCAASRNYDRAMTESERRERSKTHAYTLKTDAAGATYLQILDGRYDRVQ